MWTITTTCDCTAQLGYVTPADKLIGLEKEIFAERDRKLEEARERRRNGQTKFAARLREELGALQTILAWAEDRALLRSTPSADPGAKTGARAERIARLWAHTLPNNRSGIGTNATNLRGTMPRHPGQDAVHHSITPTGRNSISR